jgi:hypothetical protein
VTSHRRRYRRSGGITADTDADIGAGFSFFPFLFLFFLVFSARARGQPGKPVLGRLSAGFERP